MTLGLDATKITRMALLAAFAVLAVALEAAPVGLTATARPSPDLVFCVVAYFAVRRPSATPALLVFAIGLFRDLMTDVPPGLGAVSLVAAAEILRARAQPLSRQPIASEWGTIACVAVGMLAMQWLVLLLSFAQPPYLVDLGWQWFYTVLCHPLVSLILRWVVRLGWEHGEPARSYAPSSARAGAADRV